MALPAYLLPKLFIFRSIFNNEKGMLQTQKLNVEPAGAQDKEPKPGEAFLKLKDELSKRITEKRKEVIAKRLQEEAQNRQDDESEAEFEDYTDSEDDSDGCEVNKNDAFLHDKTVEEMGDIPDAVAPLSEDEDEDEELLVMYEDDVNSNDGEDDGQSLQQDDAESSDGEEKLKSNRILRAFEDDSDQDDEQQSKGTFVLCTHKTESRFNIGSNRQVCRQTLVFDAVCRSILTGHNIEPN